MAGSRFTARISFCGTWVVLALLLSAGSRAWAQAPGTGGVLPYSGVSLHGGEPPAPKAPPSGFQYVNWPGFRAGGGGNPTEVFLQLSGPVPYRLQQRGLFVQVVLERTKVYLRNNLRPMITQHFAGQPVASFRLRQLRGDRLVLEIRLRSAAKGEAMLKTVGPYTYLVVAFPNRAG